MKTTRTDWPQPAEPIERIFWSVFRDVTPVWPIDEATEDDQ